MKKLSVGIVMILVSRLAAIALLAFLPLAGLAALDVAKSEIESTRDAKVTFVNYEGPQSVVQSSAEIRGIGTALGLEIGTGVGAAGRVGDFGRYAVIRAVDPTVVAGLDADIIVIGKDAVVDHIDNVRRIVAGYLEKAWGYSRADAATLAVFITVYNAVHRGDMVYFGSKYKAVVTRELSASDAGLATKWDEWPGKTRILIPLSSGASPGAAGAVSTGTISGKEVTQGMKAEPGAGIPARQALVDIKQKEVGQAQDQAAKAGSEAAAAAAKAKAAQDQLAQAQKDLAAAQKAQGAAQAAQGAAQPAQAAAQVTGGSSTSANQSAAPAATGAAAPGATAPVSSAATAAAAGSPATTQPAAASPQPAAATSQSAAATSQPAAAAAAPPSQGAPATATPPPATAQTSSATPTVSAAQAKVAEAQKNAAAAQAEAATKAAEARQAEAAVATKEAAVAADRQSISADQNAAIAAQVAKANAAGVTGFILLEIVDAGYPFARVDLVDPKSGALIAASTLNTIRSRSLVDGGSILVAVAGKEGGTGAVRLVAVDKQTLAQTAQGEVDMFPESVVAKISEAYYAVIKAKDGKYYLGRFGADLKETARSKEAVNPYTFVVQGPAQGSGAGAAGATGVASGAGTTAAAAGGGAAKVAPGGAAAASGAAAGGAAAGATVVAQAASGGFLSLDAATLATKGKLGL